MCDTNVRERCKVKLQVKKKTSEKTWADIQTFIYYSFQQLRTIDIRQMLRCVVKGASHGVDCQRPWVAVTVLCVVSDGLQLIGVGCSMSGDPVENGIRNSVLKTVVLIIIQFQRFGITGGNFLSSPDRCIMLLWFIITFYTCQYYAEETQKNLYVLHCKNVKNFLLFFKVLIFGVPDTFTRKII